MSDAEARKQVMSPIVENFITLQADFQKQLAALKQLTDNWQHEKDPLNTLGNKPDNLYEVNTDDRTVLIDKNLVPRAVQDLDVANTVKTLENEKSKRATTDDAKLLTIDKADTLVATERQDQNNTVKAINNETQYPTESSSNQNRIDDGQELTKMENVPHVEENEAVRSNEHQAESAGDIDRISPTAGSEIVNATVVLKDHDQNISSPTSSIQKDSPNQSGSSSEKNPNEQKTKEISVPDANTKEGRNTDEVEAVSCRNVEKESSHEAEAGTTDVTISKENIKQTVAMSSEVAAAKGKDGGSRAKESETSSQKRSDGGQSNQETDKACSSRSMENETPSRKTSDPHQRAAQVDKGSSSAESIPLRASVSGHDLPQSTSKTSESTRESPRAEIERNVTDETPGQGNAEKVTASAELIETLKNSTEEEDDNANTEAASEETDVLRPTEKDTKVESSNVIAERAQSPIIAAENGSANQSSENVSPEASAKGNETQVATMEALLSVVKSLPEQLLGPFISAMQMLSSKKSCNETDPANVLEDPSPLRSSFETGSGKNENVPLGKVENAGELGSDVAGTETTETTAADIKKLQDLEMVRKNGNGDSISRTNVRGGTIEGKFNEIRVPGDAAAQLQSEEKIETAIIKVSSRKCSPEVAVTNDTNNDEKFEKTSARSQKALNINSKATDIDSSHHRDHADVNREIHTPNDPSIHERSSSEEADKSFANDIKDPRFNNASLNGVSLTSDSSTRHNETIGAQSLSDETSSSFVRDSGTSESSDMRMPIVETLASDDNRVKLIDASLVTDNGRPEDNVVVPGRKSHDDNHTNSVVTQATASPQSANLEDNSTGHAVLENSRIESRKIFGDDFVDDSGHVRCEAAGGKISEDSKIVRDEISEESTVASRDSSRESGISEAISATPKTAVTSKDSEIDGILADAKSLEISMDSAITRAISKNKEISENSRSIISDVDSETIASVDSKNFTNEFSNESKISVQESSKDPPSDSNIVVHEVPENPKTNPRNISKQPDINTRELPEEPEIQEIPNKPTLIVHEIPAPALHVSEKVEQPISVACHIPRCNDKIDTSSINLASRSVNSKETAEQINVKLKPEREDHPVSVSPSKINDVTNDCPLEINEDS